MGHIRQLMLFAFTAVVLASTPLATKISIGPDGFSRSVAAPLRMTIACVACLIVVSVPAVRRLQKNFIVRKEVFWLLGVGVTNAIAFYLTYYALAHVPSVMLTLTSATQPFMVSFLMHRTKMEHVTPTSVSGCAIAFAGIAILTLREGIGEHMGVLPILALLLAAVVVSSSSVMLKKAPASSKLGAQLTIYATAASMLWVGCAITGGGALALPRPSLVATAALLYTALAGSLLGFLLYVTVFRMAGAVTASSFAFAQPPIAFAISEILCMERTIVTPGMLFALPFILLGVGLNWIAVQREQRRVAMVGIQA